MKVPGPHWLRQRLQICKGGESKCSLSLWGGRLNSVLSAPNLPAMLSFPALDLGLEPHFCFAGFSVSANRDAEGGDWRTERREAFAPSYLLVMSNSAALEATVGPSNNGF